MKNEQMNGVTNRVSLGESLDVLRKDVHDLADDITELYDLDEDNFKQIQSVKTALETLKKRIDGLQIQVRRNRGRMILGFLGAGGLIYMGYKAIDRLQEKVRAMEGAKAEESDG